MLPGIHADPRFRYAIYRVGTRKESQESKTTPTILDSASCLYGAVNAGKTVNLASRGHPVVHRQETPTHNPPTPKNLEPPGGRSTTQYHVQVLRNAARRHTPAFALCVQYREGLPASFTCILLQGITRDHPQSRSSGPGSPVEHVHSSISGTCT